MLFSLTKQTGSKMFELYFYGKVSGYLVYYVNTRRANTYWNSTDTWEAWHTHFTLKYTNIQDNVILINNVHNLKHLVVSQCSLWNSIQLTAKQKMIHILLIILEKLFGQLSIVASSGHYGIRIFAGCFISF